MKNSTIIATGGVVVVLGALVWATPKYLLPVCEYFGVRMNLMNGASEPMHCYYTARASLIMGLLIAIIGVALMIAKPGALRALSLVLAGAGAIVVLIPTVIFPICQNPDMHCNQGAKPMLIVLGLINMMIAVWLAFASERQTPFTEAASGTAA